MSPHESLPAVIGQAPSFLAALEHASAAADLNRSLLIIGERGTGKELVAARIHFLSSRWDKDYLKVNCAALSDELLESELFGHEAGAFTGAAKRHEGRFERADGGTLFLDEIANASARVQEKILRVIEYGEFERVGGEETLSTDVRVIGATNADLPKMAEQGKFRADLLDRLAFDVVSLPPLRHRWEDIPILAEHFGRRMAAELGAPAFPGYALGAMSQFLDYAWPGNVRELRNVIERAVFRASLDDPALAAPIDEVVLDPFEAPWTALPPAPGASGPARDDPSGGGLDADSAAPTPPAPRIDKPFEAQTAAFERAIVRGALAAESGHQGRAAERLGLTYHQFRGLLRKYDLVKKRA